MKLQQYIIFEFLGLFAVSSVHEEKIVDLTPDSSGILHHLNYPAQPPPYVDFVQHLVAPIGYIISLEFHQVTLSDGKRKANDF